MMRAANPRVAVGLIELMSTTSLPGDNPSATPARTCERDDLIEPSAPEARRLLDAYVTVFETADIDLLTAVLRADATLELVPSRAW